jgi:hypothetical protein
MRCTWAENAFVFDLENVIRRREGGLQKLAGMGLFACADGFIYLMAGGIASSGFGKIRSAGLKKKVCHGPANCANRAGATTTI